MGDQDIGSHQGREGMIEDHLSLEDLLFATLDAVSRFRVGQRDTVSAALEAGPCSQKPRAGCIMASGETGCIVWGWHLGRRERG